MVVSKIRGACAPFVVSVQTLRFRAVFQSSEFVCLCVVSTLLARLLGVRM